MILRCDRKLTKVIDAIAAQTGSTREAVIERAVALLFVAQSQIATGHRVYLVDKDNNRKEITLP